MERRQPVGKTKNNRCELLHLKKRKIEVKIMKLDLDGMNAM